MGERGKAQGITPSWPALMPGWRRSYRGEGMQGTEEIWGEKNIIKPIYKDSDAPIMPTVCV